MLELIHKYGYGVTIITKSTLILRDLDLLKSINKKAKVVVQITLTTFDKDLCKKIEPNVSTTKKRFEALKVFRDNNILTIVWLCPFLPFINDTEENLIGLLNYCLEAKVKGVIFFGFGLTLRSGNREYFYKMLDKNFPGLKEKYISTYKDNYVVNSKNSYKLENILRKFCKENNIMLNNDEIFSYLHEFPNKYEQISLF